MLVRMKVGLSGPTYSLGPGDEHEFPDAEAIRLIEAEYADPVSTQKIERSVATPTRETRTTRKRKRG